MKIGQIYNVDAFNEFKDSASLVGFGDSASGVVLARHLTEVDSRILEKKYPDLSFVNSGVSVDNTGGDASRIQTLRLIGQGEYSRNGDKDGNKGKISLTAEDSFLKVDSLYAQAEWNDSDVRVAETQNVNLPARYFAEKQKIYMQTVDQYGLIGYGDGQGLLNNTDYVTGSATGALATLNAQAMYNEIASLITDQNDAVNNTAEYKANRVMMPTRVFNKLKTVMMNTANGSSTVLKALRDNFPEVEFYDTFRADTIANGGNLAVSATVAYSNNDEAIKMRIPQALTIGKIVQISSFRHHVESMARVAGLDILETTSGRILTGL